MANKFQQSVMERLEEDAKRQKMKKTLMAAQEAPQEFLSDPTEDMSNIAETKPAAASSPVPEADIRSYLRPVNLRVAKNKTFYLDTDVIEAIQRTAKAQKVTDSKLVCDILRQVLNV